MEIFNTFLESFYNYAETKQKMKRMLETTHSYNTCSMNDECGAAEYCDKCWCAVRQSEWLMLGWLLVCCEAKWMIKMWWYL